MSDGTSRDSNDELVIERFGDGNAASPRMDPMDFADLLRTRGRRIEGFTDGLGLDRTGALAAVLALRSTGVPVGRCDIVKVAFGLPEYVCETRRFDRAIGEDQDHYCRRSLLQLEEHVRGFSDPGDGSVFYVIQIAPGVEGTPE